MIEVTEEMRHAFADAAGWPPAPWMFGPDVERGIAAVLAMAERDRAQKQAARDQVLGPVISLVRCARLLHPSERHSVMRSHENGCGWCGGDHLAELTAVIPPQPQ